MSVTLALAGSLGSAVAAAAATRDPVLAAKLTTVMKDPRVTKATSAAVVLDATTGAELYARYGSRSTTPASNTKILTAVAAMETLRPSYQFTTEAIRRGPATAGRFRAGRDGGRDRRR